MSDFDQWDDDIQDGLEAARSTDKYVIGAKKELQEVVFRAGEKKVFFERQLQILLENRFVHWATRKALGELVAEGWLKTEILPLDYGIGAERQRSEVSTAETERKGTRIRFYWRKAAVRYWRREALELRKLVVEYSQVEFTGALGRQAETLFDAALPRFGFVPEGRNVRGYRGRIWTHSNSDLDRVFVRDGIAYGAEIKNKLGYMEEAEFREKLRMCQYLGLKPLFIARMLPMPWIWDVHNQAKGYCMIFKYQLYPFGTESFVRRVRERTGLPVDCPAAIADGTIERFLKRHVEMVKRESNSRRG
jgi:hypothetical protein